MKRIAKKPIDVKRSKAAKKGWATRRRNAREARKAAKKGTYESNMQSLVKELQRSQARERAAIRKANKEREKVVQLEKEAKQKAREQSKEMKKAIAREAGERMSTKDILGMMSEEERTQAQKDIIQARMDRALRLFGDVRYDAYVLSDELDMDIGEIYNAWDYEEGAAN